MSTLISPITTQKLSGGYQHTLCAPWAAYSTAGQVPQIFACTAPSRPRALTDHSENTAASCEVVWPVS